MSPASSGTVQRCSMAYSKLPASSNPASESTLESGLREHASAQPAGIRSPALSAAFHLSKTAARARCQVCSPVQGWEDEHSARCPPGWSQPRI